MDKEIDRIQKNPETDIVIRIDEFNGKKGVTIREFVKSDRYTGFTKAGTRIAAEKFHLFKKAINMIDEKDLEGPVSDAAPSSSAQSHNTQPSHSEPKKEAKKKPAQQEFEDVEF